MRLIWIKQWTRDLFQSEKRMHVYTVLHTHVRTHTYAHKIKSHTRQHYTHSSKHRDRFVNMNEHIQTRAHEHTCIHLWEQTCIQLHATETYPHISAYAHTQWKYKHMRIHTNARTPTDHTSSTGHTPERGRSQTFGNDNDFLFVLSVFHFSPKWVMMCLEILA